MLQDNSQNLPIHAWRFKQKISTQYEQLLTTTSFFCTASVFQDNNLPTKSEKYDQNSKQKAYCNQIKSGYFVFTIALPNGCTSCWDMLATGTRQNQISSTPYAKYYME